MNDTVIAVRPGQVPRVAMGHDTNGKRAAKYQLDAIAPAGALLSTVNDLPLVNSASVTPSTNSLTMKTDSMR